MDWLDYEVGSQESGFRIQESNAGVRPGFSHLFREGVIPNETTIQVSKKVGH